MPYKQFLTKLCKKQYTQYFTKLWQSIPQHCYKHITNNQANCSQFKERTETAIAVEAGVTQTGLSPAAIKNREVLREK